MNLRSRFGASRGILFRNQSKVAPNGFVSMESPRLIDVSDDRFFLFLLEVPPVLAAVDLSRAGIGAVRGRATDNHLQV